MPTGTYKPDWQRAIIALSATVVTVLIVTTLYLARVIFIPLALAVFLTFVLAPLVHFLQRRRVPRVPAVIVVVGFAVFAAGGVLALVGQQIASLTSTLPDNAERIKAKIEVVKGWVSGPTGPRLTRLIDELQETIAPSPKPGDATTIETPTVVVAPRGATWFSQIETFVSPAAEVLGQLAFSLVLVAFMLLKKEDLRNRVLRLVGAGRVTTATKAVDDASRRVSRYLLVQLLINSGFGCALTIGLLLLGVKYAALWGFFGAVMRYVPYIGTWMALVPPAVFTFALSDSVWDPIGVVALFSVLELITANALEPWLFGTSLGMSEVAQLVAIAFWLFLWGPIGVILSGPLTTCLLVLGKYVPELKFLDVLLGDDPPLSPSVSFFQRLAARDQDEASRIVQEQATSRDLVEVFDDVVVPALVLTRTVSAEGELDADDEKFILATAGEVVDEIADDPRWRSAAPRPGADRVRVLACPSKDEGDRLALEMLATLLGTERWDVVIAPTGGLSSELLDQIEQHDPAVVCIGALPPGGLAHTRYLCKRLRGRFPELKIVAGRWGQKEGTEEVKSELTTSGADEVYLSLADARHHLTTWLPVLENQQSGDARQPEKPSDRLMEVGTTPA